MSHGLPPIITLEVRTIEKLCEAAALRAVGCFAKGMGLEEREMSEREAFNEYREGRVKRWVAEGRLTYRRLTSSDRSKKLYKVIDLLNLAHEDYVTKTEQ